MGIHYDYKSTRGEKALKKEAKRKARIEQRRAKKVKDNPILKKEEKMQQAILPLEIDFMRLMIKLKTRMKDSDMTKTLNYAVRIHPSLSLD